MTYAMKDLGLLAPAQTSGETLAYLDGSNKKFGFVPNLYRALANQPGLLDIYLRGYDSFRATSKFTPVEQEVVFLVIARENACTYCVAAHSVVADNVSKVPIEVTDAIRARAPIPDTRLAALAAFTEKMVISRGRPSADDVAALRAAGFEERHILDVILAISVKVISNYVNHVFHTPTDPAFAVRDWKPA